MRKLCKLFVSSVLIGLLPSLPVWAVQPLYNWATASGGVYSTPPSAGAPGAVMINNGLYSVDYSTMAPTLTSPTSQGFVGAFYVSTGAIVAATTAVSTPTALTSASFGTTTFPANYLWAGKSVRYTMTGTFGTPGLAVASSVDLEVKLGTTTIAKTGGVPESTFMNQSSDTFVLSGILTIVSTGSFAASAGTAVSSFQMNVTSGAVSAQSGGIWSIGSSTNTSGTYDFTTTNALNITVQFTNASAGNTFIPTNIVYEVLN